MNLPTYEELYLYTLQVLADGSPKVVKEIRIEVANVLNLTQEQINFRLESGIIQFNNRLGWSLSYLKQAGAVVSPSRGIYRITDVGYNLLKEDFVDNKKLMQFESFRKFKNKSRGNADTEDPSNDEETPEEAIISKVALIDAELRETILAKILENSPFYFEKIVLKLLNAMGYGNGSLLTAKSGDGGIDGIINEDPLGFHNIYVQAKRWNPTRTVGRPEIQKFKGAMDDRYEGLNQGVFITTAKFSNEAKEYVNNLKLAKIMLIDGERLAKEMIRHKVGVDVKQIIEVHAIDLDFFTEDE
ncbi:restriction endonuclease [Enterococcus xiangfangensis]|uniref:restriction endonuclease n=1 Tax=Enterococcus xiangfangensis TaxID=1296537 RepID=UPI0010FA54E4|nr:restriction endonuclease [Enterococcus xiangfangensis]MBM7711350.1 restriction system protein [Enterococcus xiangfangensis]NBK09786.1 restriction endonuclease [Enterococcus asini]